MSDGQMIDVKITDQKLVNLVWKAIGIQLALEPLRNYKGGDKLPGFGLALALVEREEADMRAQVAGGALRQAARAGHDVGTSLNVYTTVKNGEVILQIEMPDLVDMADSPVTP